MLPAALRLPAFTLANHRSPATQCLLQAERADLARKLAELMHTSGACHALGAGLLCARGGPSCGGAAACRFPCTHPTPCCPALLPTGSEDERLRLKAQYEARIKQLDERVKAVKAKARGAAGRCAPSVPLALLGLRACPPARRPAWLAFRLPGTTAA